MLTGHLSMSSRVSRTMQNASDLSLHKRILLIYDVQYTYCLPGRPLLLTQPLGCSWSYSLARPAGPMSYFEMPVAGAGSDRNTSSAASIDGLLLLRAGRWCFVIDPRAKGRSVMHALSRALILGCHRRRPKCARPSPRQSSSIPF
ncbi:uncharacterized protein LY79DRAFT_191078 [Colletotrichum navitas]|uniref:Uncharacterized protein n=1 Tax=Colletotrichum navitas TaxID=681940 RepID=A0AAD8Q0M8_9PEZI|nr:uncharacterized protein LY79DRAFT_191078 [Colletotrichum navitas]KAK1593215.1 hypothetical protein LY79DRAFT_191078 [Colletotrichum navitas]